jgi:protein TonB
MTISPIRLIAYFSSALVHASVVGAVLFYPDYKPPRIAGTVGIEVEIVAELPGGRLENAAQDLVDAVPLQARQTNREPTQKRSAPIRQAESRSLSPPPPSPQKAESHAGVARVVPSVTPTEKKEQNTPPPAERQENLAALSPAAAARVASEAAAKAAEKGPGVAPWLLANPKPVYPKRARKQGVEGRVLLRVLVGTTGESLDVTTLQSSGHPILDEAANQAVQKWRFVPAQRAGLPVVAALDIPIVFRIKKKD